MKFEYQWVRTENNPLKDEVEDMLNSLGVEGYRVITCLRVEGSGPSRGPWYRFLLEKQTEE